MTRPEKKHRLLQCLLFLCATLAFLAAIRISRGMDLFLFLFVLASSALFVAGKAVEVAWNASGRVSSALLKKRDQSVRMNGVAL